LEVRLDGANNPDLLKDKRGFVDGSEFFLRSPFRSPHLKFAVAVNAACILAGTSLIVLRWGKLTALMSWLIVNQFMFLAVVIYEAAAHYRRVRLACREAMIHEIEPGSSLDVMIGVAAGSVYLTLVVTSVLSLSTFVYLAISSGLLHDMAQSVFGRP